MKKKLLVLSASAILVSNFIFDNSASAVVDVRENPYKSEALKLAGNISYSKDVERYLKSLDDLIYYKSINMHAGYDEPEYKEAYDKYQKKFMAEMDALNKFRQEEKVIDEKWGNLPEKTYGLTYERYLSIYKKLEKNREEFLKEAEQIESKHNDLKRFNYRHQLEADRQINNLENKILMIGKAYINQNRVSRDAVLDMYNRLDMVVGTKYERYQMLPTNQRMLNIKSEDLESIIDQFFEDINAKRPEHIEPLSSSNENDEKAHQKLRDDVVKAKNDKNYSHPRAIKKAEELAKAKKAKEEAKAKRLNGKIKVKQSSQPQKFPHKILKQTRLSKQENKAKDINVKGDSDIKKLKGMSGESNNFTVTHNSKPSGQSKGNSNFIEYSQDTAPKNNELNQQNPTTNAPVVKETITESNVVDIDQSSFYEKSGYKYGYSESDTSGYTERDKRAIRRNHVREAEELVNKYVNSHAYQDRVAAQAKVKTLSPEQQKRLNQQIDKIYNGQ
ncbi:coagulase [Staphylococcus hyicus]|uniref:coagulase domain-containing protein n=1 Tax=Staphylococcus hyicus TaxID=1284 RepID=UPI001F3745F3|nr:coagulase domain-containing protein [Staphylococcus hyicus]MCE5154111.1 coagulase [Staphylococcus hyicus]